MLLRLARRLLQGGARSVSPEYVRELISAGKLDEAERHVARVHSAADQGALHAQCLAAEIAFRRRQDARATELFRAVLAKAPGFVDAHYGFSLVLAEMGELERALEHALFARLQRPDEHRFCAQLGYCYLKMHLYPAAEAPLRMAVKLQPKDKHSWNNLGVVLRHRPLVADAKACFLQALDIDPDFRQAQENLAVVDEEVAAAGWEATAVDLRTLQNDAPLLLGQRTVSPQLWGNVEKLLRAGREQEALSLAEDLADDHRDDVEATLALSDVYIQCADIPSAVSMLKESVGRWPDHPRLRLALGKLLIPLEKSAEACLHIEKALELGDREVDTRLLHAVALHNIEKYHEAAGVMREVRAENGDPGVLKKLATTLTMACEYEDAIATYEELLEGGAISRAEVLGGYASALMYADRVEQAQQYVGEALSMHSFDPSLRMLRASIHLLHERYGDGWDDYEWRNFSYTKNFRVLPFAKWRGEPLEGKTIVVLAEQGLGDQVMFASCLPDLLRQNPKAVYVEAIDRVAKTLARSFPTCHVIPTRQKKDMQWAADIPADCYVPLGDLPKHFRRHRHAFPGVPYLRPDPERQSYWRSRLEQLGPRPWVGFSWKGGTQLTRKPVRTADISHFAQLCRDLPGSWVSLQYGNVEQALERAQQLGLDVPHWKEAIDDLDEFTALVSVLDVVVTVCNTTVHYAGALGKPTYVLAPRVPEWRYGLAFDTMAWYPDTHILRQSEAGEWEQLFSRVKQMLLPVLANKCRD